LKLKLHVLVLCPFCGCSKVQSEVVQDATRSVEEEVRSDGFNLPSPISRVSPVLLDSDRNDRISIHSGRYSNISSIINHWLCKVLSST